MTTNALTISLSKGDNVNLSKAVAGLAMVKVALGWDPAQMGNSFDLDASAIRLATTGKVRGADTRDLCFYNQLKTPDETISHSGDDLTGVSAGDDETITVDLSKQPADIQSIIFAVTIHAAKDKNQTFGLVRNAYIRILDAATGQEISRYDLTEDGGKYTSMVFGELYRNNGDWKFRALGQGSSQDLGEVLRGYGIPV